MGRAEVLYFVISPAEIIEEPLHARCTHSLHFMVEREATAEPPTTGPSPLYTTFFPPFSSTNRGNTKHNFNSEMGYPMEHDN